MDRYKRIHKGFFVAVIYWGASSKYCEQAVNDSNRRW